MKVKKSKSITRYHIYLRKLFFLFLFLSLATILRLDFNAPSLPSTPGAPPKFFSSQAGDHLPDTLVHAIASAEQSVVLLIYSLKDPKLIKALNQKAESGIPTHVIYDAKASLGLGSRLVPSIRQTPRLGTGLMHLKALVIDQRHAWLGSANFTYDSLRKNANLLTHTDDPVLARFILSKAHQLSNNNGLEIPLHPHKMHFENQEIEISFLPDDNQAASKIERALHSAQKTIRVAMFTFTRQDFAEALVKAQKRGVDVKVAIDPGTAKGASKKVADYLNKQGVPVFLPSSFGMVHHKFVWIDEDLLIHGSANWTQNAFKMNEDYVMSLKPLTPSQKELLFKIWPQFEIAN